jgi:predicted permease
LQITRTGAGAILPEQSRGAIGSLRQMRSGRLVVSLQLALSLPLLVGAGLLARTVYNLQRADLGFPAERLLLARVDLRAAGLDKAHATATLQELLGQFRRIPGVHAASFSQLGAFSGGESSTTIEVEGSPNGESKVESATDAVGPGYFSTLGVPIVRGREILESDRGNASKVCVINESFANRFFDRRSPIGMRITAIQDDGGRTGYQVVGIARNARTQRLRGAIEPRFFTAAGQAASPQISPTFLIRTATITAPVMPAVRMAIQSVNDDLPVLLAISMHDKMAPLTSQDRMTARLAAVFGCVALTLAGIGLYGVLSYGISRRTGEIAIRMALGARPGGVVSMILREAMGLAGVGLALGGTLAYGTSRWIGSQLYGVDPQDPLTIAAAIGLLLFVALGASYLPARRASRLDPMTALRQR